MRIGVGISVYTKSMIDYNSNNWRKRKGLKVARIRQMDKACWNLIKYRRAKMGVEENDTD